MPRKTYTDFSAIKNDTRRKHDGGRTVDLNIWIAWDGARKGDPIHASQYVDDDNEPWERISSNPHQNSVTRTIPYEDRNGNCHVKHMCQLPDVPMRKKNLGPAKVKWFGPKDFAVCLTDQGGHRQAGPRPSRSPETRNLRTNAMR